MPGVWARSQSIAAGSPGARSRSHARPSSVGARLKPLLARVGARVRVDGAEQQEHRRAGRPHRPCPARQPRPRPQQRACRGDGQQHPRLVAELEDGVHAVEVAAVERVAHVDQLRRQHADQATGDEQPEEALGRVEPAGDERPERDREQGGDRDRAGEVGGRQQRPGEDRRHDAPHERAQRPLGGEHAGGESSRDHPGEDAVEQRLVADERRRTSVARPPIRSPSRPGRS